jgi:hypothetical protein
MNRQRLSQISSTFLSLLIFGICIWAIQHEMRKYHIREIWSSMSAISDRYLLLAVVFAILNYLVLTGYDTLALRYIRHPLPYLKAAFVGIVAHGISNSVGFPLLSSSAIRYRFYASWGLSPMEIAKIIAFCNLSFGLGALAIGGVIFAIEPSAITSILHLPPNLVKPLAAICLSLVVGYLIFTVLSKHSLKIGQWKIPRLSFRLCLLQLTITTLDWGLVAAILYFLLPLNLVPSFPVFFGIFLLAEIAAIISNVPGGLGVLETVILLLLEETIPPDIILGSLLAFRGIYYFLPLGVGILMLGVYEMRSRWLDFKKRPKRTSELEFKQKP